MMWGYGYGGAMEWWMVVVDVVIAALVILGILAGVWLILRQVREPHGGEGSARAILEARFARGEIDEAEFQKRWSTLASHGGRSA